MPRLRKLPTSGSEPTFTKAPFGTPSGIRSNNCTAYSYQHVSKRPGFKLQPGELAGLKNDFSLASCSPAIRRVLADLASKRKGYRESMTTPCRKGYAKIALMLDKNTDYHFLRQNGDIVYPPAPGETRTSIALKFRVPTTRVVPSPGGAYRIRRANVWSHKRGLSPEGPTLYDAKGRSIIDPRKADFDYGDYDYETFCAAFCVKQKPCPKKKSRVNLK